MRYLKRMIDSKCINRMIVMLPAVISISFLGACSGSGVMGSSNLQQVNDETFEYDISKADVNIEPETPKYIDLSEISGDYVIEDGGDYIISGKSNNALVVDAQDQMVKLFFDNVEINVSEGAAVDIVSAGKVIITLLDGTNNVLEDSPEKGVDGVSSAALYSVSDLTINGTGTMSVYGYNEDAIRTKDVLKILGGNIAVKAKRDGIRGSDGVYLLNSRVEIESEGNGIVSSNIGKPGKGAVVIDNQSLSVISGKYAVVCSENLYVKNSDVFCKSVISNAQVEGNIFSEEGIFTDE